MNNRKIYAIIFVMALIMALIFATNRREGKNIETVHLVDRPDVAYAFKELYDASSSIKKLQIDKKHIASVWFEQEFYDGISEFYVVFSKKQELNENGELLSCHTCTTKIDAITFVRNKDGWTKEAVQKNIAEIGQYGDAPPVSKSKMLYLSAGNIILTIPTSWVGQGISRRSEILINHYNNRWTEIGYLDLAGNNLDSGCEKNKNNNSEAQIENPCYSYDSSYKLVADDNFVYPNIVVSRHGNDYFVETGKIENVGDDIYAFNGVQYSKINKRNINERGANLVGESIGSTEPKMSSLRSNISKIDAQKAVDVLTQKLSYCILPAAQYGQFSSFDGGKSATKILLEKCTAETVNWIENCKALGSSKEHCMTSAVIMAQVAIKSFGK